MNFFIFSFLVTQATTSFMVCKNGHLLRELSDGQRVCFICPKCSPGQGATVPCESTVPYNVPVTCKSCPPAEYSDSLSSETCKPASNCLPNEATVVKCTNVSDARCSCKPCLKGFYRNTTTSKCLPCSRCCFVDGTDEVIPQCVTQGLPQSQTCSHVKRKPCVSNCWYDEITVLQGNGNYRCERCPVCPKEMGLTVPCGSITREDQFIGCELPTLGKTYVDVQGVLQPCSICPHEQEVVANCSYKSDTSCGGCAQGFFYNSLSGSCQECFSCCSLSDSDAITQCMMEGTLTGMTQRSFFKNIQSAQVYESQYFFKSLWELDKWTLTTSFLIVISLFSYFAFNSVIIPRTHNLNNKLRISPFPSFETTQRVTPLQRPQQKIIPDNAEDTSSLDTGKVESEFPAEQDPGHLLFEKTGVEVIAKSNEQPLPSQLTLQATSHSTKPGFLEEDEILLSPVITFILSGRECDKTLEVQIPHGANMILSRVKWNIVLKELVNNVWVTISQSGQGIKNFILKSNHVSFETDHLSTFTVTGKVGNVSLPAFKRMKVAAFCSETSIGEDLIVRLYCFDDCEYSFEKLMMKEEQEGGKLVSSIESLDFMVTSEKDVEISITDSNGWQLDQASPMKLSHSFLRNSFDIIPQCDLVFHPKTMPGKRSFFVMLTLTQEPSTHTIVYASTAIKKNLSLPRIQGYRNEVHSKNESRTKAGSPTKPKQIDPDKCIIQL